jgi:hypothetical protein
MAVVADPGFCGVGVAVGLMTGAGPSFCGAGVSVGPMAVVADPGFCGVGVAVGLMTGAGPGFCGAGVSVGLIAVAVGECAGLAKGIAAPEATGARLAAAESSPIRDKLDVMNATMPTQIPAPATVPMSFLQTEWFATSGKANPLAFEVLFVTPGKYVSRCF